MQSYIRLGVRNLPLQLPMQPKLSPETVLRTYFRAKDENRPHLMHKVFCEEATLEMHVHTGSIAFPAISCGVAAITDVLVRQFDRTYENVYSFYLQRPPEAATDFSCGWLVGMSEKDSGNVRVGCGRYDWQFERDLSGLAERLTITIEAMEVLPPSQLVPVLGWLERLAYPWSSASAAIASAPAIEALAPVLQHIGTHGTYA